MNLARAIAVGVIEFVFAIGFRVVGLAAKGLFRVGGAVVRTGSRVIKGTGRAIRRTRRVLTRLAQTGVKLVARGGRVMIRGGKFVFRGLSRGFMRGVRRLRDLARRLFRRFKFRGFYAKRRGWLIYVYARINPDIPVLIIPDRIQKVLDDLDELVRQRIPGAQELINRIRAARIYPFREGLVFQAQRALEYARQGRLIAIEVTERIGDQIARFDMLIRGLVRVKSGGRITEIILETKNWTGFLRLDARTQMQRLRSLRNQISKFMESGRPVHIEWKGAVPQDVFDFLDDLIKRGLIIKSI